MFWIGFKEMKTIYYNKEIWYFLFETIPHLFLNIGQSKKFFSIKHCDGRDEFNKIRLILKSFFLFTHWNPILFGCLSFGTYPHLFSIWC